MLPWFSRTNGSLNDSVQLESMVETINRLGMDWIALTADREAIVMRIWRCYIRQACISRLLSIISCMAEGTHRPMPQRYLQSRDSDGWWRSHNLCDDRLLLYECGWKHVYCDMARKERIVADLMKRINCCHEVFWAGENLSVLRIVQL